MIYMSLLCHVSVYDVGVKSLSLKNSFCFVLRSGTGISVSMTDISMRKMLETQLEEPVSNYTGVSKP